MFSDNLSFLSAPLYQNNCTILLTHRLLLVIHTPYEREISSFQVLHHVTGCTWAQVACKKTPPTLPTECAVNLEQYAVPMHLPPSSSRHSTFVLLPVNFTNNWMLDTLAALPNTVVGVVPRQDISLVVVCFTN